MGKWKGQSCRQTTTSCTNLVYLPHIETSRNTCAHMYFITQYIHPATPSVPECIIFTIPRTQLHTNEYRHTVSTMVPGSTHSKAAQPHSTAASHECVPYRVSSVVYMSVEVYMTAPLFRLHREGETHPLCTNNNSNTTTVRHSPLSGALEFVTSLCRELTVDRRNDPGNKSFHGSCDSISQFNSCEDYQHCRGRCSRWCFHPYSRKT